MRLLLPALVIFLSTVRVSAQQFDAPVFESTATIFDDFGPRVQDELRPGKFSSSPHPGIDYGAPKGISIHAVEAGEIQKIEFQQGKATGTGAGWLIEAQSKDNPDRTWQYMHLFITKSTSTQGVGLFKVVEYRGKNVIVRFTDINRNVPVVAYTADPALHNSTITIVVGGMAMQVKAVNEFERGDRIGPVGKSGGATGFHVHVTVKEQGRKLNPFAYIRQDAVKIRFSKNDIREYPTDIRQFEASLISPSPNAILGPDQVTEAVVAGATNTTLATPISVLVNSRAGLNLNRVEFTLATSSGEVVPIGAGYDYQGLPGCVRFSGVN